MVAVPEGTEVAIDAVPACHRRYSWPHSRGDQLITRERRARDTGVDRILRTSRKSASGSMPHDANSPSNVLASFRSSVSKPSVNQR